ncbi:MAG: flagellin [Chloroflexi bacterium]|nr:flagellin [Chloroflexota bacterium]
MSVRINTNIEALNAQRNLNINATAFGKQVERLSSGLRINRAGDDAAGLSISEKLRAQINGLNQASRNSQDGISMIQTAEGSLNEVHSLLQRMRELAVQAGNETLSDSDRTAIGDELYALRSEIDRIGNTTKFNGKSLLNGSLTTSLAGGSSVAVGAALATSATVVSKVDVSGAVAGTTFTFTASGADATLSDGTNSVTVTAAAMGASGEQVLDFGSLGVKITINGAGGTGAQIAADLATLGDVTTAAGSGSASLQVGTSSNVDDRITVSLSDMRSTAIGSGAGSYISDKVTDNTAVSTAAKARDLVDVIDGAISNVSDQRGKLGAYQNRLEHTIANLGVAGENLSASESRIRDADMAAETVAFTRSQILQQAATAVLAQANQAPQSVLKLLQ